MMIKECLLEPRHHLPARMTMMHNLWQNAGAGLGLATTPARTSFFSLLDSFIKVVFDPKTKELNTEAHVF